jgi:DNA-binding transcriptional MerR regulator
MKMEEKLFSIEEVSRQVKIPKHTLRFWEKEFEGILVPSRTQGSQRRYTRSDVAMIEEIKRLRKRGKSLDQIKNQLNLLNSGQELQGSHIHSLGEKVAEMVKEEVSLFLRRNHSFDGEQIK